MPSRSVKKFTDNLVKGLLPEAKEYSVSCNGLVMRVYPSGLKAGHLIIVEWMGKVETIGKYPEISLFEANVSVDVKQDRIFSVQLSEDCLNITRI